MSAVIKHGTPGPEAPLHDVAAGNLDGLPRPILVAAFSEKEFDEFCEVFGLGVGALRAVPSYRWWSWSISKVVVHTPNAHRDPETLKFLNYWIYDRDGYVCQVDHRRVKNLRSDFSDRIVKIDVPARWSEPVRGSRPVPLLPIACAIALVIALLLGEWFAVGCFVMAGLLWLYDWNAKID